MPRKMRENKWLYRKKSHMPFYKTHAYMKACLSISLFLFKSNYIDTRSHMAYYIYYPITHFAIYSINTQGTKVVSMYISESETSCGREFPLTSTAASASHGFKNGKQTATTPPSKKKESEFLFIGAQ